MFRVSFASAPLLRTFNAGRPSRKIDSSLTRGFATVVWLSPWSHLVMFWSAGFSMSGSIIMDSPVDGSRKITKASGAVGSEHCRQLPTFNVAGYLIAQPALFMKVAHLAASSEVSGGAA